MFEDRDARAGRRIRLRVAVLPALGPAPRPDPIFVLVGGPGQSAVDNAPGYARLFTPIREGRDLVFVDQRGTGGSNPPAPPWRSSTSKSIESFAMSLTATVG